TDSGYKADDIRRAFWQPIADISQSAIAEVDRVVDEVNEIIGQTSTGYDTISNVAGEFYHSTNGFIFTFADNEFTITGYEGESDKIELPSEVLFEGNKYPVEAVASGAFVNLSTVLITKRYTIEEGAFQGNTTFAVPKELLKEYQSSLSGFTVYGYDTITSNAERVAALEDNKLNKVVGENKLTRAYVISPTGAQLTKEISTEPSEGKIAEYRSGGRMGVGNPTANDDATPKKLVYDELAKRAAYIEYSIDPTTFIITLELKNFEGKVLDSKSVDLPLETMIIGAWYDEGTVYLKVKGEEEPLAVDISDLISGLVNETTFNEQVARVDRRIDLTNQDVSAIRNEIDIAGVYGFGAFYAQEAEGARNFIGGGSIDRALKKRPTGLQVSLDDNYILSVKLTNPKGETLVEDSVDFPVESLVMNGSYDNGVLTLTLKNGNKIPIDITSLISGLVANSRKINGKPLSSDITLSASDIGAYAKSETDSKVAKVKTDLQGEIEEAKACGFALEAEKTSGVIKGSALDKRLKKIEKALNL
ncbi:MAG: hypothetical protein OSJ54_13595, partial [Oscillospiraceae bacterium]|nr:hypothetical protein [Oscillospiraceae bacterium]